jgi:hypothetical protein
LQTGVNAPQLTFRGIAFQTEVGLYQGSTFVEL